MRVIHENGLIYYPDLNVAFIDPKYWYDYYRQSGLLPKPPSKKDIFVDKLFNWGMKQVGDWLFGDANPFSNIFDLPNKIFELPQKIADVPKNLSEGVSGVMDKISGIFGGGASAGASAGASNFASQLKDLPTEVLQSISGNFNVTDKAALVDEILGSAPMSKAPATQTTGALSTLAKPLAFVGSFLDAYQKGRPSALGLGGTAITGLMNPATLPFAVLGMSLGSIFGGRRKKKLEKKLSKEIAGKLAPELGLSDVEGLSKIVRSKLKFFRNQNNNIADWLNSVKSKISGVQEEPLKLLLVESEFLGADKTKEQLKNLLEYQKWLADKLKVGNSDDLKMPPHLAITQWGNPFYRHKDALEALRAYSGNNQLLNELKALLQ